MFTTSFLNIEELIQLLQQINNGSYYTKPVSSLSNSSIGEHTRHIIELYQCLLLGYETGTVCYDKRKRDKMLETDINAAIAALEQVQEQLEKDNKELEVVYESTGRPIHLSSNYYREAYYNFEHCIHHQALIKVALIELKVDTVSAQFGVAPSTIQYRNQCAQ